MHSSSRCDKSGPFAALKHCCGQIFALISRDVDLARELIAQRRRQQALLSLRKKKVHEQRVDTIDAYLMNVEQVQSAVCCRLPLLSSGSQSDTQSCCSA